MGRGQSLGRGPEWGAGCESREQAAALSSARGGGEGRGLEGLSGRSGRNGSLCPDCRGSWTLSSQAGSSSCRQRGPRLKLRSRRCGSHAGGRVTAGSKVQSSLLRAQAGRPVWGGGGSGGVGHVLAGHAGRMTEQQQRPGLRVAKPRPPPGECTLSTAHLEWDPSIHSPCPSPACAMRI